ncbi:hypothetical protein [Fulvivirga sp.]|uniref:hypothetical protein n=1 Tax=Fulvivirga sp. TaxID=1931237 RepID=UPI0032EC37D8
MKSENVISQSGREFNSKILKEDLDWALELKWTESIWKPKDALVDKNGGSTWLYTGQTFDDKKILLVKNGWTHDHCDICSNDIRENDSCVTSDNQTLCIECYKDFIKNKNWWQQNLLGIVPCKIIRVLCKRL